MKKAVTDNTDENILQGIADAIDNYYEGQAPPVTCSLQEAANITGLPYEQLLELSKSKSNKLRVPGFRVGKKAYRVLITGLPSWILGLTKR